VGLHQGAKGMEEGNGGQGLESAKGDFGLRQISTEATLTD
jgi:hypothetical protein